MPTADEEPTLHFRDLCEAFAEVVTSLGVSQAVVLDAGGPSKPTQTALIRGDWTSSRPRQTADKIDHAFNWPPGTSWEILRHGRPSELPSARIVLHIREDVPGYAEPLRRDEARDLAGFLTLFRTLPVELRPRAEQQAIAAILPLLDRATLSNSGTDNAAEPTPVQLLAAAARRGPTRTYKSDVIDDQDRAGEPSVDDPDDFDPR